MAKAKENVEPSSPVMSCRDSRDAVNSGVGLRREGALERDEDSAQDTCEHCDDAHNHRPRHAEHLHARRAVTRRERAR